MVYNAILRQGSTYKVPEKGKSSKDLQDIYEHLRDKKNLFGECSVQRFIHREHLRTLNKNFYCFYQRLRFQSWFLLCKNWPALKRLLRAWNSTEVLEGLSTFPTRFSKQTNLVQKVLLNGGKLLLVLHYSLLKLFTM